jgi:hypothetical protein
MNTQAAVHSLMLSEAFFWGGGRPASGRGGGGRPKAGKFDKDFSPSWSWILDLGVAVVVVAALSRES